MGREHGREHVKLWRPGEWSQTGRQIERGWAYVGQDAGEERGGRGENLEDS
jgi:hypothetical protein